MCKNKSMLTKTVFYGLGVSLVIGSLVVPLGMDMLNQNVTNGTLVRENDFDNDEVKVAKNSSGDADSNEQPFAFSPTAVNQDLVKLFNISGSGELSVKDKTNLENYLKSHEGKLDLNELGNGVKIISERCFENIAELTTIAIPESVKVIAAVVFKNCKKLKKVTFAENSQLEKIGEGAFENCTNLTNIIIPNSVTKIGYSVFYNCINLQTINIPESVTEIGSYVFMNCKKLTSDSVINNSPVLFDWWVWNHQYNGQTMSQMVEIDLSQFKNSAGKNFNVISPHTFYECRKLNKIIIPKSVTTIGNWAFIKVVQIFKT